MFKKYSILSSLLCGLTFGEITSLNIPIKSIHVANSFTQGMSTGKKVNYDIIQAYIIPSASKQWFVKAAIYSHEEKLVQPLLEKIESTFVVDENSLEQCKFDLPPGWKVQSGNGMIYSSIVNPRFKSKVTISSASGSLLSNINRWNLQLGTSKLKLSALKNVAKVVTINQRMAIIVKLETEAVKNNRLALMNNSPLSLSCLAFNYSILPQWRNLEARGMRAVNLMVGNTEVTAISLPKAYQKVTANVNRWRAQVGLEPRTHQVIDEEKEEVSVDGIRSYKWSIHGRKVSILIVMTTYKEKVWFFKMMGENSEVVLNESDFSTFIKSIDFKEK